MQKTEAIVIYSFPFKDKKYMLEVFSREHGKLSFVTNKRLQPLTIVNIVFDPHRSKLLNVDIAFGYKNMLYDPIKLSIGFFVAEFLRYATRNEPTNRPLYDYLRQSLEWLDLVEESYANFHLVLMLHLAVFLGFAPDVADYRQGMLFDLQEAKFVGVAPLHRNYLGRDESAAVVTLLRMNFGTMHLFKLNKGQRNEIVGYVVKYYRLHVPGFPEMKSLDVLRELF